MQGKVRRFLHRQREILGPEKIKMPCDAVNFQNAAYIRREPEMELLYLLDRFTGGGKKKLSGLIDIAVM